MVIGGEDLGAPAWLTSIGTGLKQIGTTAAQGAAASAVQQAGVMLNRAAGQLSPGAPPPPKPGIPKGLIIAGTVVAGVALIALVAGRRRRPQVSNPRWRRRRRRRRSRR